MYIDLTKSIEISDEENPRKQDYINDYELRDKGREILFSQLVGIAMNYAKTKNTDEIRKFVDRMSTELPRRPDPSWSEKADEDAEYFILEFLLDEIVEQLADDGEFGEDINNDFSNGDSAFHETITDREYDLQEAADLLNELSNDLEEDSGLWQEQEPEQAIATQAAYTYSNVVYRKATELLEEIRDNIDMDEIDNEVAKELLQELEATNNLSAEDEEELRGPGFEQVDWVKENHEDEFKEKVKEKLEKEIKEIIKEY
jgi:hypothetical protein